MSLVQQQSALLGELANVATILEEGRSRAPLYQKIGELYESFEDKCLYGILISFNSDSVSFFLQCLIPGYPQDMRFKSIRINAGHNRISLGTDQAAFKTISETLEYASQQAEKGVPLSDAILELNGVEGVAPLVLEIAEPSKLLNLDIVELNRLLQRSNLLVAAAPINYVLTAEDRAALMQLLTNIDYLGVLALPEVGESNDGKPWHQEAIPGSVRTMPAQKISPGNLPDYLVNENSPVRNQVITRNVLAQCSRMGGLLNEQLNEKLHYLDCCEEADDFLLSLIENDPQLTADVERNKATLDKLSDELEAYSKRLQEASRAALVGKGVFYHMVEGELETLKSEDIEKQEVHNVFKLTIAPQVLKGVSERLMKRLLNRFEDQSHEVADEIEKIISGARKSLENWPDGFSVDVLELVKTSDKTDNTADHLDFKIRYKGEMPKRGFLKRLGEGRRMMFMVLMMFSIFGGMVGFNYRNFAFMGVFFVLLFVGGTVYTFFSWKKDDEFTMNKEVEKAKDQLHMEYMRAVTEVERNRVKGLSDQVSALNRKNRQDFEAWQKACLEKVKDRLVQAKERDKHKKGLLKNEIIRYGKLHADLQGILQKQQQLLAVLAEHDNKLSLN